MQCCFSLCLPLSLSVSLPTSHTLSLSPSATQQPQRLFFKAILSRNPNKFTNTISCFPKVSCMGVSTGCAKKNLKDDQLCLLFMLLCYLPLIIDHTLLFLDHGAISTLQLFFLDSIHLDLKTTTFVCCSFILTMHISITCNYHQLLNV